MLVALLALSPTSSDGLAQQSGSPADPEFAALVAGYRNGDIEQSVAALAAWPVDRIRVAARRRPAIRGDLKQIEAAAMLCSDASILVAATDRDRSSVLLEWARALVRTIPDPAAARFKERWEAYAFAPLLIPRDFIASRQALQRGLAKYPRSADLELVQGVVLELAARAETADFRGNWTALSGTDAKTFARIEGRLISAATAYERAVALDRNLWSAHLRLGWVYSINHSPTHAEEQLRIVVNRSRTSEETYLAHLFLAGLAEQQNNVENAYAEYRLAHSIRPDAQTAHLALMRVARVTGRSEEAQRLFTEYARVGRNAEDPWWYFSMGLDNELFSWLHAEIAEP